MLAVMENIGGCLVDGNRPGVGHGIGMLLPNVELEGFEMKFTCCHNRCIFLPAKVNMRVFSNKEI
jgi:hypothetical protein